jgi:hypothetical protein
MRKKAATRFCGDCGYEFARDDTGECRMCARFEQLREESAVLRPNEHANRRASFGQAIETGPPPFVEWPPTPAEYRAILVGRRTPSAEGLSRGPAATVIGTPALANPALQAPTAAHLDGSPKKKSAARRDSRPMPTAALASDSPAPPKSKARRKSRRTPPSDGRTPSLTQQRAAQQPADVTMQARRAPLAGQSQPPAEKSQAGRESRSTLPPIRDYSPSLSAAVKPMAAVAPPGAHPVVRATSHDAASSDRGYPWRTAFWVAVGGGLFAAVVTLLSPMIR